MTRLPPASPAVRLPAFPEFVTLMAVLMALTALSVDIMLPAFPAIADDFAIADPNDRQLVITTYMLGFAVGQVIYGPLSDRFGRKPMLLLGLAIFSVASLGTMIIGDFAGLLALRALQGIGCASPRVIAVAVIRDVYGGRDMARVMSFVIMVFIIIPIIAPALGGGVMLFGGWELIFLFLLVCAVLATLWSMVRLPETRLPEQREPLSLAWLARAVWQTVSTRETLGYSIAAMLIFGCLLGYINSAQQIFVDVYGLRAMFPVVFGAIAATLALSAYLNGRLVGSIGMRRLSHAAMIAFVLTAGIHLTFAVGFGGQPPLGLFCGFIALDLFFFGFIMANFNAMAMEPLGKIAGTASSFIGALTTGGAAVFGWYVGRHFDGTVVPLVTGYLVLSGLALAVTVATEKGRLFQPHQPEPGRG